MVGLLAAVSLLFGMPLLGTQSSAAPPQVSMTADGSLSVYYPESRQLLIYQKVNELIDRAAAESAVALAEKELELANASGRATAQIEAMKKLSDARKKASERPPADKSYACTARYEIPATPSMTLKAVPCQ